MKKTLLPILLILITTASVKAARPTTHASSLSITNITCHSLQLNWTNGNGSGRLIVGREGASTTWSPTDYTSYTANPYFGKGADLGSGNFIVYNSGNSNFAIIDSLKTGATYYFTIYEHDNNASSTLYLTAGNPPAINGTTYSNQPGFKIDIRDSCEQHNSFTFVNQSKSTLPGISYQFNFGDGQFSSLDSVNHVYTNLSGPVVVRLTTLGQNLGCKSFKDKTVRIYPKKSATINYNSFQDTQCLIGNYFEIDPQPIISQLPKSVTYYWDFDDGEFSTFKKMKKSYAHAGHYEVSVEMVTYVNLKATGCKDTLNIALTVMPAPTSQAVISDTFQCLKNNLFSFSDNDITSASYQWNFGDGTFTSGRTAQHNYATSGIFLPCLKLASGYGCARTDTFLVEVISAPNSNFSGLDSVYCASGSKVILTPYSKAGFFTGYPVSNNVLIPSIPGSYVLSNIINLSNCRDTTEKKFRIKAAPMPYLGRDTLILSSQQLILDAGIGDYYWWSTADTTRTLMIDGKTSPKGSKTYHVKSTNKLGCHGYDTIIISIDYQSQYQKINKYPITIFPNPVTSTLHIASEVNNEITWQISNYHGQIVLSGNNEKTEINCSELPPGIYIIVTKSAAGMQQLKFIKL